MDKHSLTEIDIEIAEKMDPKTLFEFSKTSYHNREVVKKVVSYGFKKYKVDIRGSNLKILISKLEFLEMLPENLKKEVNYFGFDWLWENRSMLRKIVEKGIDYKTRGHSGGSTLLLDNADNDKVVELLLFIGANPNEVTGRDFESIFNLTRNPKVITLALLYGGDPFMEFYDNISLVTMFGDSPELAEKVRKLLIKHGEKLDTSKKAIESIIQWSEKNS